jgi:glycosyltransferase involved in cell wall biosynthesis
MNQPLVSIGIPTYNRPSGLKDALDCITNQTYSNLEIIVSDNSSPGDRVCNLMKEYMKNDSRIRYFKQTKNIGPIENFEFVLAKAKGSYFAWASDDDLCKEEFVEKIITCMNQDSDIVLCSCDVQEIDENNNLLEVHHLDSIRPFTNWDQTKNIFFRYPTSNIFFCIYGIYRTEVIRQCSLKILIGWKEIGTNSEVPLLAKVSTLGKIAAIPEVLKMFRRHPGSHYCIEIKELSNYDIFMMRLVIRIKLYKLALMNGGRLLTKLVLLKTIASSHLNSIDIRNVFFFFPVKIKRIIKLYKNRIFNTSL